MSAEDYPRIYLYRRIVQSKLFIDENYFRSLNLEDIAEEAYFSKFHFIRIFRKTFGRTPHQYLMHVRIEKAKELLQKGALVSVACGEVGFESITSFSDLFKRIVGQTPSAYQITQRARRDDMARIPLKYIPNCFAEQSGWTQ